MRQAAGVRTRRRDPRRGRHQHRGRPPADAELELRCARQRAQRTPAEHRRAPHQQHGPPILQPRLHGRLEPGDELLHADHRRALHGLLLRHLPRQRRGGQL